MAEIQVNTTGGDYQVFVGRQLYEHVLLPILDETACAKVAVVSHPNLWDLYGQRLVDTLRGSGESGLSLVGFTFPQGEEHKNLKTLEEGYSFLLKNEITREDVILAMGGGVVGDLAGYLASSYLRGLEYLQLPTTLMAMVDSSVGGKVGVDLQGAKNAVGAFYQPRAVLCDLDVLNTLTPREFASGLAEVAKYGFLYKHELLREVKECIAALPGMYREIEAVIARCVELKAAVVSRDERDLRGERAMLNYGHTFGHALESSTGYRLLRHGEAVAVGMIMAARASELSGLAKEGLMDKHMEVLKPLLDGSPLPEDLDLEEAFRDMRSDKKRGRELRFVLLDGPQRPRLVESLPEGVVRRAMQETMERLKED